MAGNAVELSEREREILRLVATGASNKEIALRLNISPNTVKVHLRNIFEKLGVDSRTAATYYALQNGLVDTLAAPIEGITQSRGIQKKSPEKFNIWIAAILIPLMFLIVLLYELRPVMPVRSDVPTGNDILYQATAGSLLRWQEGARLPEPRSAFAISAYEGALYLFGGEIPGGITFSGLRYRTNEARWDELRPRPVAARGVQAALLGEKIYVPGGVGEDGQPLSRLDIYDPRGDVWEEGAALPIPLGDYALAAFEGRLYLFGGWDGTSVQASILIYDPLQNSWSWGSPMPKGRRNAAVAGWMGKLLVVGGFDGEQALSDVLVYFPQRDRSGDSPWQEAAVLPQGRFGMGAVSLTDTLYLFGGRTGEDEEDILPPLEYLPQQEGWAELERPPNEVGVYPGVIALGRRVHVLGGESKGLSDRHQVYQALYTQLVPFIE